MEKRPDYNLGAGVDWTLMPRLQAGITLPTNRAKIRAAIAEALALRQAAEARFLSAVADTQARVVMALTGAADAQRVSADYGERIVPATRKLLDAQLAAYGSGGGDLLVILDSERLLVDYERLILRAQTDRLRYYAELEEVMGAPLLRFTAVAPVAPEVRP